MMNYFTLSLLSFFLFLSGLSAQRTHVATSEGRAFSVQRPTATNSRFFPDTIIPAIFFDDCVIDGSLFATGATDGGYVAGTNDFLDKEKAQFIRFDAVDNYLINGVVGYFAEYDAEIADRFLTAKVYAVDPSTDGPGDLLATSAGVEVQDVLLDDVFIPGTYFSFFEPLAMDVTDFFVAIDFTDIYTVPAGNISLFMTDFDCGDGFNAWERWDDDTWHAIDEEDSWASEAEFYIGAVVETDIMSSTQDPTSEVEVNIFPNPASERINLTYVLDKSSQVDFVLLDLQGREVLRKDLGEQVLGSNQAIVELPELPFGLYVYQLLTKQGVVGGEVMIK